MKPATILPMRLLFVLLISGLMFGLISWDHKSPGQYQTPGTDTVPRIKSEQDKKVRDLDEVIIELNSIDLKEILEKAQKEINVALKEINVDKIKLDIELAMKDIDMEKLQNELKESIAKIDFDKIKIELGDLLKEIDMSKMQAELTESLGKIDLSELKIELDKIKDIDMKGLEEEMKKLKDEMKDLGPLMEKEMKGAKEEIEKVKAEMKEYKSFVDGLDQDGLINKKEDYTLKHNNGELFINGKKAPAQVYNKYRGFLEKHKQFSIDKNQDDFDIDMD